jgi:A/G-specific adenine glycosylase
VSEIMLQQTRVETVIQYYERWIHRFPGIQDLANATEQDVLSLWEGLGYYGRGRNLFKAARIIMEKYNGKIPSNVDELQKLPGIGRYTAGAIASIAYGLDEATLDANIRRVLARYFNVDQPADMSSGEKRFWELAESQIPMGKAGDFNQALMDLGATVCLPKNPRCPVCPLSETCQARQLGVQELRPVLKPKATVPHYTVTAAVISRNGKVLLAKRPSKGLLGGLWEFPGGKVEQNETLDACLRREIQEELSVQIDVGAELGVYHHAYTHFRITLHAFCCKLRQGEPRAIQVADLDWVDPVELVQYPMGKVDRQIARRLVSDAQG